MRGRPRKGSPKFKNAKSESYMTSTPSTNNVSIYVLESENEFEIKDLGNNTMKIKINKPLPYNLALVCKELVHMAWSVLPENQKNKYPHIQDWIQNKLVILPLYLDKAFIPGYGMDNVILEIWESVSDQSQDYPLFIRFTYGFSVLTFYIPKDNSVKSSPIPFKYLKNVPNGLEIEGKSWTIKQEERIRPENLEYTFRYSSKLEDFKK